MLFLFLILGGPTLLALCLAYAIIGAVFQGLGNTYYFVTRPFRKPWNR
jgi:hypothetical protein